MIGLSPNLLMMRKPFQYWDNTFAKLGFRRHKKPNDKPRGRKTRSLRIESLEPKQLLTADLALSSFYGQQDDLSVQYVVADEAAQPFDVSIYRSSDGVALDELIATERVDDPGDLAVGIHPLPISLDFAEQQSDYYLVARLDSAMENTESDETNNQGIFSGVFLGNDGILYVHGTDSADDISIVQPGMVRVDFGAARSEYTASEVAGIHVRTHDGSDDAIASSGVLIQVWAFGGPGVDMLYGGRGDDYIDGGTEYDILKGRIGDDVLIGGEGDDQLIGDMGDDTLDGGMGADYLQGNEDSDTIIGGPGDDTLLGGNGYDTLSGGDGNDYIEGNEKADQIDGGSGDDILKGGFGDDVIFGGLGADTLEGNVGSDTLDGGKGIDVIDGVQEVNTAPTTSGIDGLTVDEDAEPTVVDLFSSFEDADDLDEELTYAVVGNTNAALVFNDVDQTNGESGRRGEPNSSDRRTVDRPRRYDGR